MIKQLNIQNFQSHKDTSLAFDSGVNVITGKSDSGKTAIIRALRKLIWNRPGGESFCSHWGGDTEIRLYADPDYVSRTVGKDNRYQLNETKFSAFGQSVPEEIIKALNINEVNLQMQFDQPFLITETPGAVAQHFNQVAHLEKIDQSIKQIRSE
jgi:DNA repair protein SbcC/Rad50